MRTVESVYVRMLVDADFAERVVAGEMPQLLDDATWLESLDRDALATERRGRQRFLWARAAHQIPAVIARIDAQGRRDAVQRLVFGSTLWEPHRTLDIAPFGRGWEMASPVVRALQQRAGAGDLDDELLMDLGRVEWCRFAFAAGAVVEIPREPSRFDIERARREPSTPAERLWRGSV